jgi:cell division protein FtsW
MSLARPFGRIRPGPVRDAAPSPAPDRRRPARDDAAAVAGRQPVKSRHNVLRRERHQPDYTILVAVVALAAIGILMVYSSSAMRAYLAQDDTLAIVGPQIGWGALGIVVMLLASRVDYRYLRLVSIPGYVVALTLLVLVLLPAIGPLTPRVIGGSARWLQLGPLPALHPAEVAKLALVIYLAHWMAGRGSRIRSFLGGTVPFLLITTPVLALVFREPDLGTTSVIAVTAFTMFFVAGANLVHFVSLFVFAVGGALVGGLRGYQIERIQAFIDPWRDPLGSGFHTIQGLLALSLGGLFGAGLGESRMAGGLFLPNASNDFIFAIIGEEFGFLGASLVIGLFLVLGYAGVRTALAAPDTFGALLAAGITAWLTLQAFINIGVVVALLPITGITLPFVSAGGSSLIVSFAAVGILLSISRETQPRGTWNDADPDRRGRNRGSHLPGDRRGAGTSRPTRRR